MEEFKVGQKVFSILSGWGVVYEIDNNKMYPVKVRFLRDGSNEFAYNGHASSFDRIPTLYHEEMIVVPKDEKK